MEHIKNMSEPDFTPTVLLATGKDGPQRIRPGHKRFTPEAQAVFLDHLAASCNVSWSSEQAGISTVTAYNHRRANPGFARDWDDALGQGYVRLETQNEERNEPIRRLNQRHGYVVEPGSITVRGPIP